MALWSSLMFVQGSHRFAMFYAHMLCEGCGHAHMKVTIIQFAKYCTMGVSLLCCPSMHVPCTHAGPWSIHSFAVVYTEKLAFQCTPLAGRSNYRGCTGVLSYTMCCFPDNFFYLVCTVACNYILNRKQINLNTNSASEHAMDKIQRRAHRAEKITFTNLIFQFHFHCQIVSKYVLVKIEEAILYCSPHGQMVKLSVSQAVPNSTHRFLRPTFFSLQINFCLQLMVCI